jgi:hypothetical protein
VLEPGESVTLEPDKFPGFQVYDVAPDAVIVEVLPKHIDGLEGLKLIVGVGKTLTLAVALPLQPAAFVPVTV